MNYLPLDGNSHCPATLTTQTPSLEHHGPFPKPATSGTMPGQAGVGVGLGPLFYTLANIHFDGQISEFHILIHTS